MSRFELSSVLSATPEQVYRWHCQEGALERLTPPWQKVEVEGRLSGIRPGSRVYLRLGVGPLRVSWVAEHTAVDPDKGFVDCQVEGPFRKWEHQHLFEAADGGSCVLRDRIEYALPFGVLGRFLGQGYVQRSLERTFNFRHQTTAADMEFHRGYAGSAPLAVGLTGASGLVGSTLAAMLTTGGHRVIRLVRSKGSGPGLSALWDPEKGVLEPEKLEGLDAVVHLAGENIADGRWTARKKDRILHSRVAGTTNLVRSLGALETPPRTFLSASAIGIYGDRGDESLDETSATGSGFLADVCRQWEEAAESATAFGMRVATARTGIVLTPAGGALAKMLPAFRMGGGGRLGSGRQFMSWISIDDAAAALIHILLRPEMSGPVNLVSPNPVRNAEFTRQLARTLGRPALLPMPAFAAKALFGQMAEEALLASSRVKPEKLEKSSFRFRDTLLGPALERLLGS